MACAKTLRHKSLDLLPNKFTLRISKELLSLRIDLQYGAVALHGDDRVRNGVEELAGKQSFFAR